MEYGIWVRISRPVMFLFNTFCFFSCFGSFATEAAVVELRLRGAGLDEHGNSQLPFFLVADGGGVSREVQVS